MKLSNRGLALITDFEGLRLKAYQDSVGIWTIGYGHTGPDVHSGQAITKEGALDLLRKDVSLFEAAVDRFVQVPISQCQFDALVCFSFNVGAVALRDSTLLKLVNVKDFSGAALQFDRWDHAGGKVLKGLTRRRAAERALFESA